MLSAFWVVKFRVAVNTGLEPVVNMYFSWYNIGKKYTGDRGAACISEYISVKRKQWTMFYVGYYAWTGTKNFCDKKRKVKVYKLELALKLIPIVLEQNCVTR